MLITAEKITKSYTAKSEGTKQQDLERFQDTKQKHRFYPLFSAKVYMSSLFQITPIPLKIPYPVQNDK